MNRYVKEFLRRGLMFAGFGPIVLGAIYAIVERTTEGFSLTGTEIFVAILSIYILAFVQAGATVFESVEEWSLPKVLFFHFSALYVTYVCCYLVNSWIPFDIRVILLFTAVFAAGFFTIWAAVYFTVKLTTRKMNEKLR